MNNELKEIALRTVRRNYKIDAHVDHYLDLYLSYFRSRQNAPIRLLEIGVAEGGSLEVWAKFFPHAEIFAVDVNPECKRFEAERVHIHIGDQGDPGFLDEFLRKTGGHFDIIIDDGGHRVEQQILALKKLFGSLNAGGTYVIEDLHTSYWAKFGGEYLGQGTTIEFLKSLVDNLNSIHATRSTYWNDTDYEERKNSGSPYAGSPIREEIAGLNERLKTIHFYDSLAFLICR